MDREMVHETFLEMIQDIYHAENKIVTILPMMIEAASYADLKEAFKKHLKETKVQVTRLETIFKLLSQEPHEKTCHGIKGLIKECKEVIEKTELTHALKDACLIMATQKIEHYEIATYGTLCAFVKHLSKALRYEQIDFKAILHLLKETLHEEEKADHHLTQLAEGTRFMEGINDEAEKEIKNCCQTGKVSRV